MNDKSWYVIGLMSGTSLDGVDIVYVKFYKENDLFGYEFINVETVPYTKEISQKLKNAFNQHKSELNSLTIFYGKYLGELVNTFLKKHQISTVDFVASHGHTIFHKPQEGYTLQIGDGQTMSNITGLKVICDFRTQDVALGGQGAPLVPIGDQLLFSNIDYCLNLGGFANISFNKNNERIAFDICPVNIVLNHYANILGFDFDESGKMASTGNINIDLLAELNAISYYQKPFPKSLGFEFVKEFIFPKIDKYNLPVKDVLRTFSAHIVQQIANCLDHNSTSKIMITGGGAFNTFLINELKSTSKTTIIIPNNDLINYKEALIFALLGVLRSENQVNCLSSVTGASKDHSSGKIFYKSA